MHSIAQFYLIRKLGTEDVLQNGNPEHLRYSNFVLFSISCSLSLSSSSLLKFFESSR